MSATVSLCNRWKRQHKRQRGLPMLLQATDETSWGIAASMLSKGHSRFARYCCDAIPPVLAAMLLAAVAYAGADIGPKSGLPMPRFVSLKPDRVNVRAG